MDSKPDLVKMFVELLQREWQSKYDLLQSTWQSKCDMMQRLHRLELQNKELRQKLEEFEDSQQIDDPKSEIIEDVPSLMD